MHCDSKQAYLEGCSLTEDWQRGETMKENRTLDLTGVVYEKKIYWICRNAQ
jgi:hypothetical protein